MASETHETSEKFLTRDDILHLSEAERMMKLEMYTGSKKQKPREEWWYNLSKESIEKGIITLPECIERCFMEPLTNASDNVHRSRRWGVKPGHIYVYMSPSRIIIENKGTPIPIEFKEEEGMYVPELIFGVPGSSSHYNESVRHEAGVNGIGAKLTNVFSNRFEIEIDDHIRKKSYKQVWNGMGLEGREDPQIEVYRSKESRVRVTFDLDYDHFGYEDGRAPEETFCLFARHCADISFTTKVPVHFEYNLFEDDEGAKKTIEFELGHPKDYARLYFADAVENSFLHYEWPKGTKIIKKEDGRQVSRDPNIIPLVEMCVIDTPDASENVSFVNSMMTRDGGVHVEAALKSVSDHIVNFINTDKGDGLNITLKHVRPNISLVLTAMVENPGFSGQTKNKLSDPNPFIPRIRISKEEIQPVMEWSMIQHLLAILEAKKNALLSKSDGKKRRNISTQNGRDANEAGKRKSSQCTLYIVEGLSASSYPKKLIDNMENGRDFCGILPIRGKFLNTRKAKVERIAKNKEIAELKKMLGLVEEMDYRDPKNFKTLRYGKVVIMADSDDDGKHIVALLLLYFHCRFPSLLQIGYVYNYLTPIIRVVKGKRSHKFYTHSEYESWKLRNKNFSNWKHIYFKGLGRTTDAQIEEDFHDQHVIHCLYDDYAPETIELAFAKEMGDERKAWLAYFSDAHGEEVVEEAQPISQFLNTELIKFGLLNLRRAIPCMMDGLKDSQRKVMWGAYQIWNTEKVGKIKCGNATYKEMKVARIAADAAGKTNYHHGERSLENTIVAMAQDFTGSNNLPYFCRDGQFGTRDLGGKDAAESRYAETKPEWWIPYVFRREDIPILQLKEDEGEKVEPVCFYPILPVVLINGCNGIATAYSTFIPNHNPLDIVQWLKCKIQDKSLPELKPWYRGFSGSVEVVDRRARKQRQKRKNRTPLLIEEPAGKSKNLSLRSPAPIESTSEEEEKENLEDHLPSVPSLSSFVDGESNECEEGGEKDYIGPSFIKDIEEHVREFKEETGRPLYSMITKGDFYANEKGQIVITELPIGKWTHPYCKWLEKLRDEYKIIKDIRDLSKSNNPGFELTGYKDIPCYKSLRLKSQHGMSNMVLLDIDDKPHRYDSVYDYLEAFYEKRLYYYGERKIYVLSSWNNKIAELQERRRFIRAIISKDLIVENRLREDIYRDMDEMHFSHELVSIGVIKFSEDEIVSLDGKIEDLQRDIVTLESTPPEKLWLRELQDFERQYRKHYKIATKGDKLRFKMKIFKQT